MIVKQTTNAKISEHAKMTEKIERRDDAAIIDDAEIGTISAINFDQNERILSDGIMAYDKCKSTAAWQRSVALCHGPTD